MLQRNIQNSQFFYFLFFASRVHDWMLWHSGFTHGYRKAPTICTDLFIRFLLLSKKRKNHCYFVRYCQIPSREVTTFYNHFPQQYKKVPISTSLPTECIPKPLGADNLVDEKCTWCHFNLPGYEWDWASSPVSRDHVHFCVCVLCLFISFTHFSIGLLVFFFSICKICILSLN